MLQGSSTDSTRVMPDIWMRGGERKTLKDNDKLLKNEIISTQSFTCVRTYVMHLQTM